MGRLVLPVFQLGQGRQPFDGLQLFFYETNSSTPKVTYSDNDQTTESTLNANGAVESDEYGVFPDVFGSDNYKVVMKDKNDVQLYEWDPVTSYIETPTQQLPFYEWSDVVTGQSLPAATSHTVSGIDPTATQIRILVSNMQTTGTNGIALRVGDGSIKLTDYLGSTWSETVSGGALVTQNWTNSALNSLAADSYASLINAMVSGYNARIEIIMTRYGDEYWAIDIKSNQNNTSTFAMTSYRGFGRNYQIAELDRIQVLTGNADTFTQGAITVQQWAQTGSLSASGAGDNGLAEYGDNGSFFENSGTFNDLVLELPADTVYRTTYPPLVSGDYVEGTQVDWVATGTNSGAMTVKLGNGPIVDLKFDDGTNIPASFMTSGYHYTARYSSSDSAFLIPLPVIPDGYLTTDMYASASITADKLAAGAISGNSPTDYILQTKFYSTNSYTSVSAVIPFDNTIPQSTEGTSILSGSITPLSTSNKVRIFANVYVGPDGATAPLAIAALFRDGVSNALTAAAVGVEISVYDYGENIILAYTDSPSTTSSVTYSVRVGKATVGESNVAVNGYNGGAIFGGAAVTSMELREIKG